MLKRVFLIAGIFVCTPQFSQIVVAMEGSIALSNFALEQLKQASAEFLEARKTFEKQLDDEAHAEWIGLRCKILPINTAVKAKIAEQESRLYRLNWLLTNCSRGGSLSDVENFKNTLAQCEDEINWSNKKKMKNPVIFDVLYGKGDLLLQCAEALISHKNFNVDARNQFGRTAIEEIDDRLSYERDEAQRSFFIAIKQLLQAKQRDDNRTLSKLTKDSI